MEDKLKTLKDLTQRGEGDLDSWIVRQEAINWIKYWQQKKRNANTGRYKFYCEAAIDTYIHFFNIIEEDLKIKKK